MRFLLNLLIILSVVYTPYSGIYAANPPPPSEAYNPNEVIPQAYRTLPKYKLTDILGENNSSVSFLQKLLNTTSTTEINELIKSNYKTHGKAVRYALDAAIWEAYGTNILEFYEPNGEPHRRYLTEWYERLREPIKRVLQRALDQNKNLNARTRINTYTPTRKAPSSAALRLKEATLKVADFKLSDTEIPKIFERGAGKANFAKDISYDFTAFGFTFAAGTFLSFLFQYAMDPDLNPRKKAEFLELASDPAVWASIVPFFVALRVARKNISAWEAYKKIKAEADAIQSMARSGLTYSKLYWTQTLQGLVKSFIVANVVVTTGSLGGTLLHDPAAKAWSCIKLRYDWFIDDKEELKSTVEKCYMDLSHFKSNPFWRETTATVLSSIWATTGMTVAGTGIKVLADVRHTRAFMSLIGRSGLTTSQVVTLAEEARARNILVQGFRIAIEAGRPTFRVLGFLGKSTLQFAVLVTLFGWAIKPATFVVRKNFVAHYMSEAADDVTNFIKICLFRSNTNPEDCNIEKYEAGMNEFNSQNVTWRGFLLESAIKAQNDYYTYFANLLNRSKAAKNLYADIIWQLREYKKKYAAKEPFAVSTSMPTRIENFVRNSVTFYDPIGQVPLFNELPLFESDPLHGVEPNYRDFSIIQNISDKWHVDFNLDGSEDKAIREMALKRLEPQTKQLLRTKIEELLRSKETKRLELIRKIGSLLTVNAERNTGWSQETRSKANEIGKLLLGKTYYEKAMGLVALRETTKKITLGLQNMPKGLKKYECQDDPEEECIFLIASTALFDFKAETINEHQDYTWDVKPTAPGAAYLKMYDYYLSTQLKVNTDYYPRNLLDRPVNSMVEFLVYSMMCAHDPITDGIRNIEQIWSGYKLEFYPPRITKNRGAACGRATPAEGRSVSYATDKLGSFFDQDDILNVILGSGGNIPSEKTWYFGSVDYLLKNIDPKFLADDFDFNKWWNEAVENEYVKVLEDASRKFNSRIIEKEFKNNFYKEGYVDAATSTFLLPAGVRGSYDFELKYYFEWLDHLYGTVAKAQKLDIRAYQKVKSDILAAYRALSEKTGNVDFKTRQALKDQLAVHIDEMTYLLGLFDGMDPAAYPNLKPIKYPPGNMMKPVMTKLINRISSVQEATLAFMSFWTFLEPYKQPQAGESGLLKNTNDNKPVQTPQSLPSNTLENLKKDSGLQIF